MCKYFSKITEFYTNTVYNMNHKCIMLLVEFFLSSRFVFSSYHHTKNESVTEKFFLQKLLFNNNRILWKVLEINVHNNPTRKAAIYQLSWAWNWIQHHDHYVLYPYPTVGINGHDKTFLSTQILMKKPFTIFWDIMPCGLVDR